MNAHGVRCATCSWEEYFQELDFVPEEEEAVAEGISPSSVPASRAMVGQIFCLEAASSRS